MSLKDVERGQQSLKKAFLLLCHIWKLVENMLVWVKRPNSFQYGTWRFPWSRQSATNLKLYFPFVKTHFHSPYNSLLKEKQHWTKVNFDPMHNKYHIQFFLFWCNTLAGNLALIIKNSELTSISSFGEICISLNVKYVDLSSEVGWLAIPFSFCA